MAALSETLVVDDLVKVDDGHAYVLSRDPDDVEAVSLPRILRELELAGVPEVRGRVVLVPDLTETSRAAIEKDLTAALLETAYSRLEAFHLSTGGADWSDELAARQKRAEQAVRASFDRLPAELP